MTRPLLIVVTPVRNEAWVLEAFLTHCSSWADYIILADQHSTDGSREIALRFPKVKLLDNPTTEWVEYEVRAMLLAEAQRIAGDKIIFALDADEFLSKEFCQTEGWHRIMQSTGNVIYQFRWLNLYGDMEHGMVVGNGAEWACHFDEDVNIEEEYRACERHAVHCQRVPCLEIERCQYVQIEDIRFVHLGGLHRLRNRNKLDFYQVVNYDKNYQRANSIALYRSYTDELNRSAPMLEYSVMPDEQVLVSLIHTADHGYHYVDEMVTIFQREGFEKFRWLCIWDNPDLRAAGINYRPPLHIRLVHRYLHLTTRCHRSLLIRTIDKVLKLLIHP